MKRPSISRRLTIGTGFLVTVVLFISNLVVYRTTSNGLFDEVRRQLLESSSLLAKSTEMEASGMVYEWSDALESAHSPPVTELFQREIANQSSQEGHAGLGLAPCREIAGLLGARLEMLFENDTTVTLHFRLNS